MKRESIHIAGVGGVGMSALAQSLLDQGAAVSGSDRLWDRGDTTATLKTLERQGVRLFRQDGSGVTDATARLVVSSAIEGDNPEVRRAEALGVPVVHRATELARVVAGRELIAVTGTCGKSSVTAMLGTLLEGAGFDPLVVNGAAVPAWSAEGARIGAVRKGAGPWAVVEADESDRSLVAFKPQHVIVTNACADHFGIEETREIFAAFKAGVSGVVIDGECGMVAPAVGRVSGWSGYFEFEGVEYCVPLPGKHNICNAWHAVRMARALGAEHEALVAALAGFSGIERRLQRVGEYHGAVVVDDYAHNPDKLAAAWETLAEISPAGVCAVWRPHGYTPLRKMMDGLTETFARVCRGQDRLFLLPVYDMGGTVERTVQSRDLAVALERRGVKVACVESLEEAGAALMVEAAPGVTLVTFGARDPGLPRLARQIVGR